MRDLGLQIAAGLLLIIGLAHSYLGERYILTRLLRRDLPKLFGSDWFTKRTLRFAWHLTTVAWWGFGVLLLLSVGERGVQGDDLLRVIAGVFGISGLTALFASRGRHLAWIVFLAVAALAIAATGGAEPRHGASPDSGLAEDVTAGGVEREVLADVRSVAASGTGGSYEFAVGIESPDRGCDQYANWWEVVGLDGELVYRRILTHSHISEQPFVRRGGPVSITGDTEVWVRAYMHPTGYGGVAFKGSVASGFSPAEPPTAFASTLAEAEPQPEGCAN